MNHCELTNSKQKYVMVFFPKLEDTISKHHFLAYLVKLFWIPLGKRALFQGLEGPATVLDSPGTDGEGVATGTGTTFLSRRSLQERVAKPGEPGVPNLFLLVYSWSIQKYQK